MSEKPTKYCFLDKVRECTEECKAHKEKDGTCRLINSSNTMAAGVALLQQWLGQANPPRIT